MKYKSYKIVPVILVAALVLSFSASVGAQDPIKVGHLSYHTGDFASVGPWFDGIADFTIQIINEDPPLGRPFEAVHDDIGTVGEAQVARKLVENGLMDVSMFSQVDADDLTEMLDGDRTLAEQIIEKAQPASEAAAVPAEQ